MGVKLAAALGGSIELVPTNTASNFTVTVPAKTGTMAMDGPAFSAWANATTSLVTGGYIKILFGTEDFDTNNNFASSRFTPTVEGYYQISGSMQTASSAIAAAAIYRNGTQYKLGTYSGIAFVSGVYNVTSVVYLNGTTDYVELYGYNGSTTQNITNAQTVTYFNGAMVRGA